jgi:(2R)-3-sulfolactate dehydrogenase (NADP+)
MTRSGIGEVPPVTTITLAEAEALAQRALEQAGTATAAAQSVAKALARAEADGLASHGLARVPAYAAQVQSGKVAGQAVPELIALGAGGARVDAHYGFAFPALDLAIDAAAELAGASCAGAVAITHSHHFGVAGHHVERLAGGGLIGLIVGNSPGGMAPWGGRRALFGTNPIAFACPRRDAAPLVIDVSLSKVARGKVMVAAQRGEPIPADWALDAEGRPTTDAKAALAGTMLPLGDAKGAALALMVEILAAALTGAHFAAEASSFFDDQGPPPGVGQCLIAIDPGPFSGGSFLDRLEVLLGAIEAEPGARLPGTRRLALRTKAATEGITVPEPLLERIRGLAGR